MAKGKIHRKNQIWLYEKFLQEQEQKNEKKIEIKKGQNAPKGKNAEIYYFLDMAKLLIPVGLIIIAIILII